MKNIKIIQAGTSADLEKSINLYLEKNSNCKDIKIICTQHGILIATLIY